VKNELLIGGEIDCKRVGVATMTAERGRRRSELE